MAQRSVFILHSLNGTFNFQNMIVSTTALQVDRKNVVTDIFKLIVSVKLGDTKTSRVVLPLNLLELVSD